jgi:hypothetical protein
LPVSSARWTHSCGRHARSIHGGPSVQRYVPFTALHLRGTAVGIAQHWRPIVAMTPRAHTIADARGCTTCWLAFACLNVAERVWPDSDPRARSFLPLKTRTIFDSGRILHRVAPHERQGWSVIPAASSPGLTDAVLPVQRGSYMPDHVSSVRLLRRALVPVRLALAVRAFVGRARRDGIVGGQNRRSSATLSARGYRPVGAGPRAAH